MVGLSLKKGGGITLDADLFFENFESNLRRLVPSVDLYKMRRGNNDLLISFKEGADFLAAVRSASGVNIAVEVGWLFEEKQSKTLEIDSCFLRFQLSNECADERLSLFLDDLSLRAPNL